MPDEIITTSTSPKFLGTTDLWKGLLVAVISAVLTVIQNSIAGGTLTFNWKSIGLVALSTGVAYLLKNLFTPPQTTITPPPTATAGQEVTVKIPAPGQKITQTVNTP